MQSRSIQYSFLLILSLGLLFSCEEFFEEIFDDPFLDAGTEVLTHQPQVNAENVIFMGEVKNVPRGKQIEYGFMWFRSDDDSNVHRIPVGRRTSDGVFKATAMNLPRREGLVVCSYVNLVEGDFENEVIGEERDFYWGF